MNKIRVIDLLNKIANGEEVPKRIKWEDTIFVYSEYDKDYLEFPFSEEEYQGLFCMKDSVLTRFLDDEVEILEEKKKTPEKSILDVDSDANGSYDTVIIRGAEYQISRVERYILGKINEIIDYLKSKGE